jgi:hypothetical protein|tara:strand:- start:592 stop:870 length:279 start_codon:yes stop_codon:yes gene_type:complete
MTLFGRRRFIISSSYTDAMATALEARPEWSASFHSTSSCGIDNCVFFDMDCQDIDHLASIDKHGDDITDTFIDHSWAVVPNYPPTGSLPRPF